MRGRDAALVAMMLFLAACADREAANHRDADGPSTRGWWRPDAEVTWQWQLTKGTGATVTTSYDVDVYDLDLFDTSPDQIKQLQGDGRRVVCYFSAGSVERWRDDVGRFGDDDQGEVLDGWPDERWLDLRSGNVRAIMADRLDLAAAKGCDGVEPDNTDGYANDTGLDLTRADTLAYLRWLVGQAHDRGLGIGLKNTLALVDELAVDFYFAVNEQWHEYEECPELQPFLDLNKPVLNAEYVEPDSADTAAAARARICAQAEAAGTITLILPLALDDGFRVACNP